MEILLLDQDSEATSELGEALTAHGHRITVIGSTPAATELLGRRSFDAVVCNKGSAAVEDAVAALGPGAAEYLSGPFEPALLAERVNQLKDHGGVRIIGRSAALLRMLGRLDLFAVSDAPVMITGESGTGKELVARSLHERSARSSRPFLAVNCAGLPETLLETELFGHERGAFTGAVKRRDGRFRAADTGTLFLDEVAEIPLAAQAKLLRVLQEGSFEPLGSNQTITVNVRVLSATHRNLQQRVSEGLFRQDLYYRLKILELEVPTLRNRPEDIPLLAGHFLDLHGQGRRLRLSPSALAMLMGHPFPGNVRELEHAIRHAIALADKGEIEVTHFPADIQGAAKKSDWPTGAWSGQVGLPLREALQEFERQCLRQALSRSNGKKGLAAEELGISRKNLWERMRRLGLAGADETPESD